jgi:hypothetical protein
MSTKKRLLRASAILVLALILTLIVMAFLKQTFSGPPSLFAYLRVLEHDAESPPPRTGLLISNAGPVTVLFRIRLPMGFSPSQKGAHRRLPWVRAVNGEIVETDDIYFGLWTDGIIVDARRRNTDLQRLLHGGLRAAKALIATHSLRLAKKIYKSDAASYEFSHVYELVGTAPEWVNRSDSTKAISVKLTNTGFTFRYP